MRSSAISVTAAVLLVSSVTASPVGSSPNLKSTPAPLVKRAQCTAGFGGVTHEGGARKRQSAEAADFPTADSSGAASAQANVGGTTWGLQITGGSTVPAGTSPEAAGIAGIAEAATGYLVSVGQIDGPGITIGQTVPAAKYGGNTDVTCTGQWDGFGMAWSSCQCNWTATASSPGAVQKSDIDTNIVSVITDDCIVLFPC